MMYNYVKHLNTWFIVFKQSKDARPVHASLYQALFQLWNINRFTEVFYATRGELMQVAKIASSSTYSKAIKEMVAWGWMTYVPGNTFYGCSRFRLTPWAQLQLLIIADADTQQVLLAQDEKTADDGLNTAQADEPKPASTATPSRVRATDPKGKRLYKTSKTAKQSNVEKNKNKNYNEPL